MKTLMILFAVMACTLAKDTLVNLANKDPIKFFRVFLRVSSTLKADTTLTAQEARMRLKNFRKFVADMARANDEDEGVEYESVTSAGSAVVAEPSSRSSRSRGTSVWLC